MDEPTFDDLVETIVAASLPPIASNPMAFVHLLLTLLPPPMKPSRLAGRAIEAIARGGGKLSLSDLAAACHCSTRTVRASVLTATGLSPKQLGRIARLRQAIDLMALGIPLKDLAVQAGFADQAHMTREFRSLLGQPPRTFGRRLGSPNDTISCRSRRTER